MKKALIVPTILLLVIIFLVCEFSAAQKTTVFKNVNLVSMLDDRASPEQTVIITGGRISKIGPADRIDVPAGAVVIDGSGKYLMPGLADMHAHYTGSSPHPFFDLFLANGVTTVRD